MEWKYFNSKDIGSHIVIIIITVSLQLITSYISFLSSTPSIIYNVDKIKNKMGCFFFIKITNYNKKTINGVQFRISKGEIDRSRPKLCVNKKKAFN